MLAWCPEEPEAGSNRGGARGLIGTQPRIAGLFLMQTPARRIRPAWAIPIRFSEEADNDD